MLRVLSIFILCTCAAQARASEPWPLATTDHAESWKKNLFKRFADDQVYMWNTWSGNEARRLSFTLPVVASLVMASGSTANGIDLRWERSIQAGCNRGCRPVAEALTRLGDGPSAAVLVGGTYLISRWTGNDGMSRAASLSAEALLNTSLYSGVLKRLISRTRPANGGNGEFFVPEPRLGQSPNSFPSGHAMGAFAVATVFASEYRHKRWVPWVAYGTAGLVATSRVALGRHFPSDVVAGAMLGHSLGRMVLARSGSLEDRRGAPRFQPVLDPQGRGFGLAYHRSW